MVPIGFKLDYELEDIDKATVDRFLEINRLPGDDKKVVFVLLDAFFTNRKLKSVMQ